MVAKIQRKNKSFPTEHSAMLANAIFFYLFIIISFYFHGILNSGNIFFRYVAHHIWFVFKMNDQNFRNDREN